MRSCPFRILLALCVVPLAACTASMNEPSNNGGANGGGGGGGRAGGGGNAGNRGGNAGSGGGSGGTVATIPGTVVPRRLNRLEYDNTVRDLLGLDLNLSRNFPADELAHGFDNNGEALTTATLHLEGYQRAAETLATAALAANSAARTRYVTCDAAKAGDACVQTIVRAIARRAWRRPVTDAEVMDLAGLVKQATAAGDGVDAALGLALQAILLAPDFLYRLEPDAGSSGTSRPLDGYEVASRLSYLAWSSMPDDDLFAAAEAGKLKTPEEVGSQLERLFRDPKARGFTNGFGEQWMDLRKFARHEVDVKSFPSFDQPLKDAMAAESKLLFADVVSGQLGVRGLFTTDATYVNDRLAQHYGLPKPGSTELKRVTLPASSHRAGFLTNGSFLVGSSYAGRTSVVLRGRWIVDLLLCRGIADPPKDVAPLPSEQEKPATSARQRLEEHRKNPQCASCHAVLDPPGFALESFDASAAYRTQDNGVNIDARGRLDGRDFDGAIEMQRYLAEQPALASCFASKLYTYAMGRAPSDDESTTDADVMRRLGDALGRGEDKLPTLLRTIVTSEPFRTRRLDPATKGGN